MATKQEILDWMAGIIEESRPGCGQKCECFTECGQCGAIRIFDGLEGASLLDIALLTDYDEVSDIDGDSTESGQEG